MQRDLIEEQNLENTHQSTFNSQSFIISLTEEKLNFFQGLTNFCLAVIGLGVLGLPTVSIGVGYVGAVVILVFIGYLTFRTMRMLTQSADKVHYTGGVLVEFCTIVFNEKIAEIINIFQMINQVSTAIAYVLFIGMYCEILFRYFNIESSRLFNIFISIIIVHPISMITNLYHLHRYSKVGISLAFSGIGIFYLYLLINNGLLEGQFNYQNPIIFNHKAAFKFLGVSMFALNIQQLIIPLKFTVASRRDFRRIESIGYICITFFYALYVVINILFVQEMTNEISLFNIKYQPLLLLNGFLYALSILISYPLMMLPVFQNIDFSYLNIKNGELKTGSVIMRTFVNIVIYIIAYQTPSVVDFLGFIGSVFGVFLQFFLSIGCYCKVGLVQDYKEIGLIMFVLVLSVFIIVFTVEDYLFL